MNALALYNFLYGRRYIFVFAMDQARRHLKDGDLAPKSPVHLAEFQTNITTAHDNQVLRKKVDVHHRAVGQILDLVQPRQLRHNRASANIDKYSLGR